MSLKQMMLNDLYDYDYKIYQVDDYFKFSIDSILLAEFIKIKKGDKRIIDLCTGNAPVPMILNKKFGNSLNITAVEIQEVIYNLALDSVEYNNINNIHLINDNVLNILDVYKNNKFDIVSCNPPYFKTYDEKTINDNKIKAIARHEIEINLEQIIETSSKIIKNQGYFYMVHRPERLADIINLLSKYNFGLKRVEMIHNDEKSKCCFILIEAVYNGKNYVKINRPIFLNKYKTYKNIFD